ncbi:hypothetical protein L6164_015394 [Bauhinia variegata]|uniref:Uncharacterized protein n=1 Tax=Bauhinia variegata TaxID=167791 RepID=A0ACB9NKJ3_BAUVA|nr:hypothetical protein L6164_015394 [Bauhinia variegata]
MATTRLLRTSGPLHLPPTPSSSSLSTRLWCQSKGSLNAENIASGSGRSGRKLLLLLKASPAAPDHVVTSKPIARPGMSDLVTLPTNVAYVLHLFTVKRKLGNLHPQILIERAILDCRFFTLLAVVGSLLGSVLCFLEGFFLVIETYLQYFHILSRRLDRGHLVQLLIEAIDMFLVGTAMLIFGVGLYVMFVRSGTATKAPRDAFYAKLPPSPRWIGMQSIAEAKSKIGHAVTMVLQVGLLDKFKNIPLVTGFDLACFAAAVLTSSACIFLLSRLHR